MRTYMDAAGLEDATVHCLRHSFAKNLVDTGTPLQTTRRYVRLREADLRKTLENIS